MSYIGSDAWKDKRRATRMLRYRRNQALMRRLKEKPCYDCHVIFPHYVMDFDHRDPTKKTSAVSTLLHKSPSRILAEIAKCDLVCSNCHRIRTFASNRLGPRKYWSMKKSK